MKDKKLLTPHEAEIDKLLQIMAVLIDKLGGEVIVNRHEIEAFFDVPVVSRVISPDYIRFRVDYPEEMIVGIDLSDDKETPPNTTK
jgi:hypothetical protein